MILTTSCGFWKTKVVPAAKKLTATKLTDAVVKVGECSNRLEVQSDVYKLLKLEGDEGVVVKAMASESLSNSGEESLSLSKSFVGDICKSAAKLALPPLLAKGVPDRWDCKLEDLNSRLGELADKACARL